MEQNNTGSAIIPQQGWSWGGFMFNAAFLLGVKRYKFLWWYLLMFVPFLNFICLLGLSIYLGIDGHAIAAQGTQFANQSEYDGYIKGQDHAGKIFFFFFLGCVAVGIIAAIAIISFGLLHGGVDMHMHSMNMQPQY